MLVRALLLEGPDQAVEETFERSRSDPRHTEVRLLYRGPCTALMYAHYNMDVIAADDMPRSHTASFDMLIDRAYRIALNQEGLNVRRLLDEIIRGFTRISNVV